MAKKNNIGFLGLSNTTLLLIGGGVALYYLTRPKTENRTIGSIEGVSKKKKYKFDTIINNLEKIESKLREYATYAYEDSNKYGEWYYNKFRGENEFMYNSNYYTLNDNLWKPIKNISDTIEKLKDIQDFVLENDL